MGIMEPAIAIALLCLTTISATSHAGSGPPLPIHPLRPQSGSGGHRVKGVSCLSWRLAVETNNIHDWKTIPTSCENYVGNYMLGGQYRLDSAAVTSEAAEYAESLKLSGNGKDVFIFDIDETSLSNLPYYAHHGFGVEIYNATAFNAWVATGKAPALPESLKLYKKLMSLGIKVVFLTGRTEDQREITELNLKKAGFYSWEKLLLKGPGIHGSAVAYKSGERRKLVDEGYRIVGNIGDQWSDILGSPGGERSFKLPDPMYYIA